jgi:hypothetical protein
VPAARHGAFAQFPALAGHRFDLPIEAVVADRLILVECQLQVAEPFVVECVTPKAGSTSIAL